MSAIFNVNAVAASTGIVNGSTRDATAVTSRSGGLAGNLVLVMVLAGLWLHVTPYAGLGHDAQAYAVEALVHLRPDIYAQDLFLAVRSQEEFTVFPRLYSVLIDAFGLENAAAWTVGICHVLWFAAAFLLVRQLAGTTMAFFAVGLLITVSGTYGGFRVFHFAENFLTARLPAEVLSLFGLWLFAKQRLLGAGIVLALALAIHPLIGFPVAILAACAWVAERRPPYIVAALLAVGVMVAIAGAWILGGPSPLMEGRWLMLTQMRSGFLFVDFWRASDWNNAILSLITLVLTAAAIDRRRVRLLAGCAAGVALAGLALAAICSIWLHLEILLQGQPWRWLWVARLFAIAFLPLALLALWRDSSAGRSAALLLSAAWLFVAPISSKAPALLMLPALLSAVAVVVWTMRESLSSNLLGIARWGGRLLLGVIAISSIMTLTLTWTVMQPEGDASPGFARQVTSILAMLTPALLVAVLAGIGARVAWTPFRGAVTALVGAALVGTGMVSAMPTWTARSFSGADYEKFASWRTLIPEDREVLWYDNLRETWLLLERRSYLTRSQSGGVVFSEALADEVVRRALVLEPYIDRNFWIAIIAGDEIEPTPLSPGLLSQICRDPELGFIVSEDSIGSEIASLEWPQSGRHIHLYRCADFRAGS